MNDFVVSMMLLGAISSQSGQMPFWATTNQFGIMPESSGALALLHAGSEYDSKHALQWHWGAGGAFRTDSYGSQFMLDEAYAGLKWKKIRIDAGMKHADQMFMAADPSLGSLGVTAGNCMMSGNARPMPGYAITVDPFNVPLTWGHLQVFGRFGDYSTIDARYVQRPLVHNFGFGFRIKFTERLMVSLAIDNYTLWGGYSPMYGQLNVNWNNYFRVITGAKGGADAPEGDRLNSLGDHRGSQPLRLEYRADKWTLILQHDVPYDDHSGMEYGNFPDGINTISVSRKDKTRWISDIVYEYAYTMFQSGDCERRLATEEEIASGDTRLYFNENDGKHYLLFGGADNYCNNFEDRSGWTAFGRQIGMPLFFSRGTNDGSWSRNGVTLGTWNNLVKAHHFGLSGSLFHKYPYRLMLTYSRNYGAWFDENMHYGREYRFEQPLRQFSAGFTASIPMLKGALVLVPGVYFDKGYAIGSGFAATLSVKYQISK